VIEPIFPRGTGLKGSQPRMGSESTQVRTVRSVCSRRGASLECPRILPGLSGVDELYYSASIPPSFSTFRDKCT
jgi:hypothetical protein